MAAAADMLRRCTTRFASNGPCNCGEKLDLRNYSSKFQTISISKLKALFKISAIAALVNLNLFLKDQFKSSYDGS